MNHLSQEGRVTLGAEEINVPNNSMPTIQLSDRRDNYLKGFAPRHTQVETQTVTRRPPKGEGKGMCQHRFPQGSLRALSFRQQINIVPEGKITL